ncbi:hypothetical protein LCGC14_0732380 [marine sediment metagenome]|uniref:DUF362 domain-containing protein n=1 Tax=marine sediment metagenome TaxID=412755 RepID=A0A0F9TGE2_9ZZZZ|nr:MAG: hypothetical protein Lokiarch_23300 [Candidatus Lokiarchaeum sp. GC14_75]HEC38940.1 DUF362 domain-containing protein [bacterium]
MTKVFISDTKKGIERAVEEIFSNLEKDGFELNRSKDVYIKVNGINIYPHVHTKPEVLEAVIKYVKNKGRKIYVMENSSQCAVTRVVFAATGYKEICDRLGAEIIYLDEEDTKSFEFKGKSSVKDDPKGYNSKLFRMPETIVRIIENRDKYTYINLPKLKTHCMTRVTLGIKNQWGYPQHEDRGKDHNFNLHSKLVDVFEYIRPDVTIIDGTTGTIHGHYPPIAFNDKQIIKFDILIGGKDTLSVDVVGARIFGMTLDEVPHLKIAQERGLGEGILSKIDVIGKNLDEYKEKYEWDLVQQFPEDVKIVKGKDLVCIEGCQNNTLNCLQLCAYDAPDTFKGGWFIIMGKGHDKNLVEQLKEDGYTKGLVVGFCAVGEVGEKLRKEFGKGKVYFSGDCNNLAETLGAELALSGVNGFNLMPNFPPDQFMKLLAEAREHGSTALL